MLGVKQNSLFITKGANIFTTWLHLFQEGKVDGAVIDVCLSEQF